MSDPVTVGVQISASLLAAVCPSTPQSLLIQRMVPVQRMLDRASASTPARVAAALAQLAVESNYLRAVKEEPSKASGPYFESYDPPSSRAARLGNTQTGDGARFCGRGLFQLTGRSNYRRCGLAVGLDLEGQPELLESPDVLGIESAWYWTANGLETGADLGDIDDVSCRVNAGVSKAQWLSQHGILMDAADCQQGQHGIYGLVARRQAYQRARAALGIA